MIFPCRIKTQLSPIRDASQYTKKSSDPFDNVNIGAEVSLSFNSWEFSQASDYKNHFSESMLRRQSNRGKSFNRPFIIIVKTQKTPHI